MAMTELEASLLAAALQAVRLAQSSEAVLAAVASTQAVSNSLKRVNDIDPGLSPEMLAALAQVNDLLMTLGRMADFLTARYEVATEQLTKGM